MLDSDSVRLVERQTEECGEMVELIIARQPELSWGDEQY